MLNMKHRGPFITLLVAGAAFATLLTANAVQSAGDNGAGAQPPAVTGSPAPSGQPTKAPAEPPTTVTLDPATPVPTATASTPPTGFPAKATYAGRTADRRATIAIAVLNGRAAGYFCDGRAVEAWLTGTVSGGVVTLRSKSGDTVRAQLTDGSLTGTITVGSRTLSFDAGIAKAPAGLYRARGATTTIGWIVLPDGSQVGISSSSGRRTPAPRLDPDRGGAVVGDTVLPAGPVTGATVF
jgi:hypothetical protein